MKILKNRAFTLAEVLITLGIIGVVAAITIPSLITDCKAIILRSQFQKAYAKVQLVHRQMVANDEYWTPEIAQSDVNYYRAFPGMIAKYIAGARSSSDSFGGNGNIQKNFKSLGYTDMNGNVTSLILWYTDDGYVEFPNSEIWWIDNGNGQQAITVDINGYKNKPNKWGYDLFSFFYDEEKGTFVPDTKGDCNNIKSSWGYNGRSCASKAAKDPDYFKKLLRKQKV